MGRNRNWTRYQPGKEGFTTVSDDKRKAKPRDVSKVGLKQILKALDDQRFRLPETATDAQIALASKAREMIMQIMTRPTRHAQAQLSAARQLLEEACGKVADQVKIDEHHVTVEIKQTPNPSKKDSK